MKGMKGMKGINQEPGLIAFIPLIPFIAFILCFPVAVGTARRFGNCMEKRQGGQGGKRRRLSCPPALSALSAVSFSSLLLRRPRRLLHLTARA